MKNNNVNILSAFANLVIGRQTSLSNASKSHNTMNRMGEGLEEYVKDLFCNSFNLSGEDKIVKHSQHFSYTGNQNNPPDIMLRGGDAIEVKKIESQNSQLALNSSYPKDILHSDDPRINERCKSCEKWDEKDMFYIVGHINGDGSAKSLEHMWMVQGKCYAANREIYTEISNTISYGINNIPDVEFAETNELARINKVDPLGITYLRVRGMWGIDNPTSVFQYLSQSKDKMANLLLLTEKYNSFPEESRNQIEDLARDGKLIISDVKIKDPNNPADLLEAKLLSLE